MADQHLALSMQSVTLPEYGIPTVRTPEGYPELETFRGPNARGSSNIPKARDEDDYNRRMRRRFAQTAEFRRKQAVSLGLTKYRWAVPAPMIACDIALNNAGKVFSYLEPPPSGHPCEGECHAKDWCRCVCITLAPK